MGFFAFLLLFEKKNGISYVNFVRGINRYFPKGTYLSKIQQILTRHQSVNHFKNSVPLSHCYYKIHTIGVLI
jgi:hypothetical protein